MKKLLLSIMSFTLVQLNGATDIANHYGPELKKIDAAEDVATLIKDSHDYINTQLQNFLRTKNSADAQRLTTLLSEFRILKAIDLAIGEIQEIMQSQIKQDSASSAKASN